MESNKFSILLSPEPPPWIAYTPHIGPATPMQQTTQSPSLFQEYFHQNFATNHHNHDDPNMNPNPITIPFYYPTAPLPASPTGVFINPTKLSCPQMSSFLQAWVLRVKANAVTSGSTKSGATAGDTCDFLSSSFFHDDHMKIMNIAGFKENVLFGGIMNHQSSEGSENLHATPSQEGGDDDEMTKGFLGIKVSFSK